MFKLFGLELWDTRDVDDNDFVVFEELNSVTGDEATYFFVTSHDVLEKLHATVMDGRQVDLHYRVVRNKGEGTYFQRS